jgi:hypothetical protein
MINYEYLRQLSPIAIGVLNEQGRAELDAAILSLNRANAILNTTIFDNAEATYLAALQREKALATIKHAMQYEALVGAVNDRFSSATKCQLDIAMLPEKYANKFYIKQSRVTGLSKIVDK